MSKDNTETVPPINCSFCAKDQKEVVLLIAGGGCFICDGCVEICVGMVCANLRQLYAKAYPDALQTKTEPGVVPAPVQTGD